MTYVELYRFPAIFVFDFFLSILKSILLIEAHLGSLHFPGTWLRNPFDVIENGCLIEVTTRPTICYLT